MKSNPVDAAERGAIVRRVCDEGKRMAAYFETLDVPPGSRWAKTIHLDPWAGDDLNFIAKMIDLWKAGDPLAPSRVRVYGLPESPLEGISDDLRSYAYLYQDSK